jgi:hypothetical protein
MMTPFAIDMSSDLLEYEEEEEEEERVDAHAIEVGESKGSEYYEEVLVREIIEEQTREEICRAKICYIVCVLAVFGVFVCIIYLL